MSSEIVTDCDVCGKKDIMNNGSFGSTCCGFNCKTEDGYPKIQMCVDCMVWYEYEFEMIEKYEIHTDDQNGYLCPSCLNFAKEEQARLEVENK